MGEQKTKAEKLIARGSELPEVAEVAKHISEFLVRLHLGQAQYAAEIVEKMLPGMTENEARKASGFFLRLSSYFAHKAEGEQWPYIEADSNNEIRNWHPSENYAYKIHKLFCVLACDLDYCADNPQCWETRSAFCKMNERSMREKHAIAASEI